MVVVESGVVEVSISPIPPRLRVAQTQGVEARKNAAAEGERARAQVMVMVVINRRSSPHKKVKAGVVDPRRNAAVPAEAPKREADRLRRQSRPGSILNRSCLRQSQVTPQQQSIRFSP